MLVCACTGKGNVPQTPVPGSMAGMLLFLTLDPAIIQIAFSFSFSVAILGMHTLMSNQQYYEALGSSTIVNKEGLNSK